MNLFLPALIFSLCLASAPLQAQEEEPSAEETRMSWALAGGFAGATVGIGLANLISNNLPEDRIGARVGLSILGVALVPGLAALTGWAGHTGGDSGWNADVGASIASAQAFGWIGAGLGYAISSFTDATPEVQLISTVSAGLGSALLAVLIQALAVRDRGLRPLPSLAAVGFGIIGGGLTALISGIAGSENVGRNALLGSVVSGFAGGILGFALAI